MSPIVQKYGGSSVADAEKIKNIARRRHTLMALARANRLAKSQKTRTEPKTAPVTAVPPAVRRRAVKRAKNHPLSCVVIGSSTGGPPALQAIIPRLPRNMPVPILVAQHMPAMFTKSLADRLDEMSALSVKEAEGGEEVKPGTVLIAPGGRHMTLRKLGSKALVQVSDSPEDTIYKPCVDVTANSVVKVFGRTAMGVILTGMGSNGAESFQSLHTEGGIVLAQSPDTCVVYGMPRAVVDAGIADDVVDIDNMADEIMSYF